jgi:hypothetical protein
MSPGDRNRIEDMLLQDPAPSCRAVSRATGYSDWTIRKIARELNGDPRPMRQPRCYSTPEVAADISPLTGWLVFGGLIAGLALTVWAGARHLPPPEI